MASNPAPIPVDTTASIVMPDESTPFTICGRSTAIAESMAITAGRASCAAAGTLAARNRRVRRYVEKYSGSGGISALYCSDLAASVRALTSSTVSLLPLLSLRRRLASQQRLELLFG